MKNTQYIFGSIAVLIIILLVALFGYLSNQQNITKNRIDNLYAKINSDKNDINKINSLLENQTTQLNELSNYTYNNNSESNIKKDNTKITKDLPNELPAKEIDSKIKTNTTDTENTKTGTIDSNSSKSMQSDAKVSNSTSITNSNHQKNTENCLQEKNFIDVNAHPSNSAYEDPQLEINCNGDYLEIYSNGIPTFEFKSITPNALSEQNHNWKIPLNPKLSDNKTEIPLLGTVAIAIDGLPYYGANEGPPQGYADPFLDRILDFCNGHTAPQGDYHYHAVPDCILSDNIFGVIGYSLDGFEIMSPSNNIKSSWQKTSNATSAWEAHEFLEGSGDLDKCNGKLDEDGEYRYYSTFTFPYIIGCYSGIIDNTLNTQTQQNPRQNNMRPGGQNPGQNMRPGGQNNMRPGGQNPGQNRND